MIACFRKPFHFFLLPSDCSCERKLSFTVVKTKLRQIEIRILFSAPLKPDVDRGSHIRTLNRTGKKKTMEVWNH
jgi:hypothetical protein